MNQRYYSDIFKSYSQLILIITFITLRITPKEKIKALEHFREELEAELRQQERLHYMGFGVQHMPELKVRGEHQKGGID